MYEYSTLYTTEFMQDKTKLMYKLGPQKNQITISVNTSGAAAVLNESLAAFQHWEYLILPVERCSYDTWCLSSCECCAHTLGKNPM